MTIGTCVKWAQQSTQVCSQEQDQGHNQCTQTADHGYSTCSNWAKNCCTWWPCSWACKVFSWICTATVWIANIVCVAWTWIADIVCIAWTVIVTAVCVLYAVVTALAGWVFSIIAAVLFYVPIIGGLIRQIVNLLTSIIWFVVGLLDLALSTIFGVRWLKKARICIIILNDPGPNGPVPVTTPALLQPAIANAQQILLSQAKIALIVEEISTAPQSADDTWILNLDCGFSGWLKDLWITGSYLQARTLELCKDSSLGALTGLSPTIIVFCVNSVAGAHPGCDLGALTNYIAVPGSDLSCFAHEIGHKLGLWNCCPANNLANTGCAGTQLTAWQIALARASKYVTYI
jgi:hypothetical protein